MIDNFPQLIAAIGDQAIDFSAFMLQFLLRALRTNFFQVQLPNNNNNDHRIMHIHPYPNDPFDQDLVDAIACPPVLIQHNTSTNEWLIIDNNKYNGMRLVLLRDWCCNNLRLGVANVKKGKSVLKVTASGEEASTGGMGRLVRMEERGVVVVGEETMKTERCSIVTELMA